MRRATYINTALWLALLALGGCDHSVLVPVSYKCTAAGECATGVCHAGICVLSEPRPLGGSCVDRGECRSLSCVNGTCRQGHAAGGLACRFGEECASTACVSGKCTGAPPPDAGPDAPGGDGPARDGPRPEAGVDKAVIDLPVKPEDKGPPKDLDQFVKPDKPAPTKDGPLKDKPVTPDKTSPKDGPPPTGKLSVTEKSLGLAISTAGPSEDHPSVAWGAGSYLVAWTDKLNGDVLGAWVHATKPSPPTGKHTIVDNPSTVPVSQTAAAHAGNRFLVVWNQDSDIMGRLVDPVSGKPTGPTLTIAATSMVAEQSPAVASSGAGFLVVWMSGGTSSALIKAARVLPGSATVKPAVTLASGTWPRYNPAAAFGGGRYLVVWQDGKINTNQGICGLPLTVDTSGKLKKGTQACVTAGKAKTNPAVAYGSNGFLVAWQEDSVNSIRAALFDGKGVAGKTQELFSLPCYNDAGYCPTVAEPALAWDGGRFVLVWSRSGVGKVGELDLYARVVLATGIPHASLPLLQVSTEAGDQRQPYLARGAGGSLVVWTDGRAKATKDDVYGGHVTP